MKLLPVASPVSRLRQNLAVSWEGIKICECMRIYIYIHILNVISNMYIYIYTRHLPHIFRVSTD